MIAQAGDDPGMPIAPLNPVNRGAASGTAAAEYNRQGSLDLFPPSFVGPVVFWLLRRKRRESMRIESPPHQPYTIEDQGREIKIWALRSGYGRWFCFNCRQSGTTYHEPTVDDCERMAEVRGRSHACLSRN